MKVKGALIDFDGVVFDSWPIAWKIMQEVVRELRGVGIDAVLAEKIKKMWGLPGKIIWKNLFPEMDLEGVRKIWEKAEEEAVKRGIPLIPGSREALAFLRERGILVGLITNRGEHLFPHIVQSGLLECFDFIQTWKEISGEKSLHPVHLFSQYHKPQPEVFDVSLEYFKQRGVGAQEIIYAEDSLILHPGYPTLKEAAEQKGITFLGVCTGPIDTIREWVLWGGVPKKNILGSIADLPAWIERHEMGGD